MLLKDNILLDINNKIQNLKRVKDKIKTNNTGVLKSTIQYCISLYWYSEQVILWNNRRNDYQESRRLLVLLLRDKYKYPLQIIQKTLNRKTHWSIIYLYKQAKKQYNEDIEFRDKYDNF